MVIRRTGCVLLIASVLVTSVPALGAGPDHSVAEARLHFDRGVALYGQGSLDAALAEFTRAHDLTRDYRLLYNIAQVQAERHDYARAIGLLTEYLQRGSSGLSRERRAEVEAELSQMGQRVAELWVTADVAGAEVWVGQHLIGQLPLTSPIRMNAGPSTIRVVKPGYEVIVHELVLAGGDRPRLELRLTREAREKDAVPHAVDHTWAWVGLSAAGGFAAGSAVFAVLASRANAKLDDALDSYPSSPSRIEDARSSVRRDAIVSDVLGGAAIVSAVASLYFLLSGPREDASSAGGTAARIVPSPTGLWLDGTF
jgi:tetratricopeptide (TPR) repeat protein